jgi:predicted 3-demethylubiquinone-9 3-methyltransferase (glyoxalase superfamily)
VKKIVPCLWFDGQAEEAARFYTSILKAKSKIGRISYYGEAGPLPKGTVLTVTFTLLGREFMALNGGPDYKFTPALSLSLGCDTQAEIDVFWEKLSEGGKVVQCGWLEDRYGLSWQIVPNSLLKMVGDKDPAKSARVMKAIHGMIKLDLRALEKAYRGRSG